MVRRRRCLGGVVMMMMMMLLAAAACSSTTTDTATTGGSAPGGASSFALDKPLKIVGLWEVKGESPSAVDNFENGAQLALTEINAAGGVGGKPVEYQRVSAPIADPQTTVAAFLKAVDAQPGIIVGGGGNSEVLGPTIGRSGIPVISPDVNVHAEMGGTAGSENLWNFTPHQPAYITYGMEYLTKTLGAKNIGLLGLNTTYGQVGMSTAEDYIGSAGLNVFAKRDFPLASQDLTEQVLAMKGADGILDWSYPNNASLVSKQLAQNGIDVPTMNTPGLTLVTGPKGLNGPPLANAYSAVQCNTHATDRPQMVSFVKAYQDKYGTYPNYIDAVTYDLVHFAAASVTAAQSTKPDKVNGAIGTLTYDDGVCEPNYHADGAHNIGHTISIVKFKEDGTWAGINQYTTPDLDKGGS